MSKKVDEYRKRRTERILKRLDAKDDNDGGRWVTTENDNKLHISDSGVPDKGNPFVLARSNPEYEEAAKNSDNAVEFWMNLSEDQQKTVGKNYKQIYEMLKKSAGEKSDWVLPKGKKDDMPVALNKPRKDIEVRVHSYSDKSKTADADEDGVITLNRANSDTWSDYVFMHEIGHQISALGILNNVAQNPGGLFGRYNQKHNLLENDLGFAEKNPDESFADMFAYYKLYPEKLKEKSPDVSKYFDKLTSSNPWLDKWVDNAFKKCNNLLEEQKK